MSTGGRNILVGGDFNAHAELWGSNTTNSRGRSVQGWIEENGLIVLNDGRPTRIACPPNTSSAIDITLATPNSSMFWNWALLDESFGSDHIPIITTFRNPRLCGKQQFQLKG
uniref:Endonuclease/exonuclease/phosphatase domain-containing protein n=1 Tax=Phlebotomus papatasi TaxID=29031 RepID=A0A1B0DHH3_PHLPP